MSTNNPNPFSGPYVAPAMVFDPSRLPPAKPGGLVAVAVLALIFGGLGVLGGCTALTFLPFQSRVQNAFPPSGPGAELQQEMQTAMNKVNAKYFVGQIITNVAHLSVAACLVVGGIRVVLNPPRGRKFLIYALLAVIAFEVLRAAFYFFVQLEMLPIMDTYSQRVMSDPSLKGNPAAASMGGIMKGAMVFGLILGLMWPVIKIVIYGVSARYLSTAPVVNYFAAMAGFGKPKSM